MALFVDIVTITVKAGDGGNGCVSFHREKFVQAGGPDGGDGGRGGDVIFEATERMHTLMDFRYTRKFTAGNGEDGSANRKTGKSGENAVILVPPGTIVREKATGRLLLDLYEAGVQKTLARGGKGGFGNQHFATPTRQAPQFAKPGEKRPVIELTLELKSIADVGLVGFPNVVFIDSGTMTPVKLGASVYPADAAQNVTWKSGNNRVVRVDNNGVLTPVKKGKTVVTVSANDGTGVKRTFYVAVGDFSKLPYYIEVDKANQVVRVYERGDGTYTHLIRRMVCSTGRIDSKLPDKLYEMSGARLKWCRAADGHLYMQYATRIYSSYMFHGVPTDGVGGSRVKADYYRKLGERASGGCIRMLCADAKWIFDNVPNGSFVLVMKGARNPAEYGSVTVPAANQTGSLIWDPTDDNPANPYYNADYTSEVE